MFRPGKNMKMPPIMNIAVAVILILLMPTNMDAFKSRLFTGNMMQSKINLITINHSKASQNPILRPVNAPLFSPINLITGSKTATQHVDSRVTEVSLATAQANLNKVYLSGRHVANEHVNRLKNTVTYTF